MGFNITTQDGESVEIVEKKPDAQKGTLLIAADGRVFADDYNTINEPYQLVDEEPEKAEAAVEEEQVPGTSNPAYNATYNEVPPAAA